MTVARWTLAGLCTLPLLLAGCDRGGTEAPDRPIEGGVDPDLVTPFVVQSEGTPPRDRWRWGASRRPASSGRRSSYPR